jgi:hypothetical protein
MSESPLRRTTQYADEKQAHRAELGIVAGYIHELSQRHESGHAVELSGQPEAERPVSRLTC